MPRASCANCWTARLADSLSAPLAAPTPGRSTPSTLSAATPIKKPSFDLLRVHGDVVGDIGCNSCTALP